MDKLYKLIFTVLVISGAVFVSDLQIVQNAHAEGTSIWATGSESEVSELDRELSAE